jgi:hypothetical protein
MWYFCALKVTFITLYFKCSASFRMAVQRYWDSIHRNCASLFSNFWRLQGEISWLEIVTSAILLPLLNNYLNFFFKLPVFFYIIFWFWYGKWEYMYRICHIIKQDILERTCLVISFSVLFYFVVLVETVNVGLCTEWSIYMHNFYWSDFYYIMLIC